jgi:hypothetical protein
VSNRWPVLSIQRWSKVSSSSAYIILIADLRSHRIWGNATVGPHALRQLYFLLTCVRTRSHLQGDDWPLAQSLVCAELRILWLSTLTKIWRSDSILWAVNININEPVGMVWCLRRDYWKTMTSRQPTPAMDLRSWDIKVHPAQKWKLLSEWCLSGNQSKKLQAANLISFDEWSLLSPLLLSLKFKIGDRNRRSDVDWRSVTTRVEELFIRE